MVSLDVGDAVIPAPDSPISEEPPTLTEVILKGGKAVSICIPADFHRTDSDPMACMSWLASGSPVPFPQTC